MDVHVHPFEVLGSGICYAENLESPGIWSSGSLCYLPPASRGFDPELQTATQEIPGELQHRMQTFFLRRLYMHTGPRCFKDQLSLGGISRALLLPVARPGEPIAAEMDFLFALFAAEPRFLLGYCVPGDVPDEGVESDLQRAVSRWDVRALKVHPNLSRIDPRTSAGRERIETLLAAAGRCGLPLVLHGGPSPGLADAAAQDYGRIQHLEEIDFGLSSSPVVIAHAGAYGLSAAEVDDEILPRLQRLFDRWEHLSLDLSALSLSVQVRILRTIEPERVLFGSDALYDLPWKSLVRLFLALRQVCAGRQEELLVRIAGTNPVRLFEKERSNVVAATAKIFAVH